MKHFFLFASSLLLVFVSSSAKSLYSDSDPLWQLNSTNFHSTVLGKSNTWIIEFYSSWCGHCIRFAPTWKQFAQEIKTWKHVVKVGAIDCNDAANIVLCRQYEVALFPTIKMFWRHTNETYFGEPLKSKRDVFSMENGLIDFLESHWDEGVPPEWPDIRSVSTKSLADLTNSMPATRQSMMLYIEQPDVYTGRKVILDLSWQKNVLMKRILTINQRLMKDLNFKVATDTVPAVIRLFRNDLQLPLFKFTFNDSSSYIRDQVFQRAIGSPRNKTKMEDFFPPKVSTTPSSSINAVYMTDIENAVFNLLSQEIAVTKTIEGEKLLAVKSFLYVLKNYFPGSPPVMAYLSNLYNWVLQKAHSISGEEFAHTMEQMQGENEYLSKMHEFIACKGSQPQFRGYPCSLWTLFHTLTVQADSVVETRDSSKENSGEVLFAIRDYVKNFFSCQECSTHFSEMAINVENEVNTTRDAVLWLWGTHNKVNHRLAGDVTEDPEHPKIQFPPVGACPACQSKDETSGDIIWDQDLVLKYLHQFYGRQNIIKHPVPFSDDQNILNNSAMVNNFNVSFNEKWNFQWFTNTDISLCLSLYLVSALLLVIIFFLFRQRRRRRKSQLGRFQASYA